MLLIAVAAVAYTPSVFLQAGAHCSHEAAEQESAALSKKAAFLQKTPPCHAHRDKPLTKDPAEQASKHTGCSCPAGCFCKPSSNAFALLHHKEASSFLAWSREIRGLKGFYSESIYLKVPTHPPSLS